MKFVVVFGSRDPWSGMDKNRDKHPTSATYLWVFCLLAFFLHILLVPVLYYDSKAVSIDSLLSLVGICVFTKYEINKH